MLTRFAIALSLLGCVRDPLPLDGADCPCVDGFACCPVTRTCMAADLVDCPIELVSVEPSAGPLSGGTALVVTGSQLPAGLTITLGDALCIEASAVDARSVTCRTPPGAAVGAVTVNVSTAAGRHGVLVDGFEYLALDDGGDAGIQQCDPVGPGCPITLDVVEPNTGPLAGGTRVTINGANFPADLRLFIGDAPCADLVVHSPQEATCRTPPAPPAERVVSLRAEGGAGRSGLLVDAFRYVLPTFTDRSLSLGETREALIAFGRSVTIEDFDGDGWLDLYFSLTLNELPGGRGLFSGGPDFGFTDRRRALGFTGFADHDVLIPGDFDGDGQLDVVLVYRFSAVPQTGANLGFLRGLSGGRVGAPEPVELFDVDERHSQRVDVTPVDIDGDGDLDLLGCRSIGASGDAHRVLVHIDNDEGRLVELMPAIREDPEAAATRCHDIAVADYDADGDPDLALCGESLRLYRNDGGTWTDATREAGLDALFDAGGALEVRCHGIDWVDIDADGRLDLSMPPADNTAALRAGMTFARNAGGRFARLVATLELPEGDRECPRAHGAASIPMGNGAIGWLDVDHDGDPDLLLPSAYVADSCLRRPYLLRSQFAQGRAEFLVEPVPLVPAQGVVEVRFSTGAAVADLDRDGDLDAAFHSWGGGRRIVLRNNLMENDGVGGPGRPGFLRIAAITDPDGDATDRDLTDDRPARNVSIDIDLDGPMDAPDFAPGAGKLAVSAPHGMSYAPSIAHFGVGDRTGPFWVRVLFADGSVAIERVDLPGARVEVRDCAAARCGPMQ